ncbi:MAG: hypothetical protein Q8L60_15515 [Gammaproteobacteria bacterium]|nr:hypothetical protein [Gammaproteobacteria bacterium]MDP2141082.1 hypothetical protein [Gammaproteobacteria bacterium]MDP2348540.1 hypothetical protein [Gammaproteobacteria bacterium]
MKNRVILLATALWLLPFSAANAGQLTSIIALSHVEFESNNRYLVVKLGSPITCGSQSTDLVWFAIGANRSLGNGLFDTDSGTENYSNLAAAAQNDLTVEINLTFSQVLSTTTYDENEQPITTVHGYKCYVPATVYNPQNLTPAPYLIYYQ